MKDSVKEFATATVIIMIIAAYAFFLLEYFN